jgi:hypothetical protein
LIVWSDTLQGKGYSSFPQKVASKVASNFFPENETGGPFTEPPDFQRVMMVGTAGIEPATSCV